MLSFTILLSVSPSAQAEDGRSAVTPVAVSVGVTAPTTAMPMRLSFDPYAPHERPRVGPIPEPGTLLLLTAGLVTMLYRSPSRRQRARVVEAIQ